MVARAVFETPVSESKMPTEAFVFSDFFEPPGGLQVDGLQAVSAAGGFVSTSTAGYDLTNHPGTWLQNTGATSAVGRSFLLSQFTRTMRLGVGGVTRFGVWFQSPFVISGPVDRYVLRAGWSSMLLPNTIITGITFEYQDDQNGGRWQGITDDGIGQTVLDTGVTVVAFTWYFLEIEINAAGTLVEFFIDGVSVGTLATTLPTGAAFDHFVSIHIMKLLGTLNRATYIDAWYLRQEVVR